MVLNYFLKRSIFWSLSCGRLASLAPTRHLPEKQKQKHFHYCTEMLQHKLKYVAFVDIFEYLVIDTKSNFVPIFRS